MMKDYIANQDKESEEFDRLLAEFLKEEVGEGTSAETFSYKGCTYEVPAHERSEQTVRYSGLSLSWGKQSFSPEKGEAARFFVDKAEGYRGHFMVYMETTDCGSEDECCPVAFYVYREGKPRPLSAHEEGQLTGFCSQNDLPPLEENLTPGRYFLLMDGLADDGEDAVLQMMGHYACLPFVVMEAGDGLYHPMAVAADVRRPEEELETGPCTSGLLCLSVRFAAPLSADCEFSALCYTEDWRLQAQDARLLTARRQGERTVGFRFRSDLIWMAGNYTVILQHNREPFAAVSFKYGGESVSEALCRPLSKADVEYRLVKDLAENGVMQRMREFTGMARLRPRLAELMSVGDYNVYCQEQRLAELQENIYMAVTSETPFHAKRLAYCLPKLLNFGTSDSKMQDCAEWLESDTPDDLLDERAGQAIILYNIGVLASDKGLDFLAALEEVVADSFSFWSLILCGTEEELQQLFARSPILEQAIRPELRLPVERPSLTEVVHGFQQELGKTAFRLDAGAENELARQVEVHYEAVSLWPREEIFRFVMKGIVGRMKGRIRNGYVPAHKPSRSEMVLVKAEDLSLEDWLQASEPVGPCAKGVDAGAFTESMKELDGMVGLQSLKEALATDFCRMRFNEQRRRLGLVVGEEAARHVIFTGNPGTGKTTVARLLGKVYHALGLLSKGEVISTERRELVGEYIGQTEEKLNALLRRAQGNVLFIDEAYSLCTDTDDRRDYGHRVVEGLLSVLTEPHPDMLVVLAGYEEEMERLLQSNPGLRSRFPYHYRFADYDAGELMQIACRLLEREDYRLTPEAEALLRDTITDTLLHKDRYFANARWMNQFIVSGVLPAMARRVMEHSLTDEVELYRTIERADVEEAVRRQASLTATAKTARPRIGFKA